MKTDPRTPRRLGRGIRTGTGVQCVVVTGNGDAELVVHLLAQLLNARPRTRARVVVPEQGAVPERVLAALERERCTHALLRVEQGQLSHPEWELLCPRLCVLTGTPGAGESIPLARRSRNVVYSPDEPGWQSVWSPPHPGAVTYSQQDMRARITARNLRLFPSHVEFEAVTTGRIQRVFLPVAGGFTFYHGLCALACGLCLGLDWEEMARALRCARGLLGRMEVLPIPAACSVVLDKADTVREVERLLTCAREFTAARLICLLSCSDRADGQMLAELGGVAEQLADRVILMGDGAPQERARAAIALARRGMTEAAGQIPDRDEAVDRALHGAGAGDVIVLAGGRAGETADAFARERARIMAYFSGERLSDKDSCGR